jgi:[acyl-carrier-protein] S-malonyltransferase
MMTKKIGFVFPGQGSQTIGMLADIAKDYSEVKATFDEASTVLGYDLWQLVQEGPAEVLDRTVHTQPALLAASYAIWRILKARSTIRPVLLAGHSLGEYTALVCAESLSFHDGITLVAARGEYMQEAVPLGEGALAAIIGLDDNVVRELCEQSVLSHEVLAAANYNSAGQVVIAGTKAAVLRAIVVAKEKGARLAKCLSVSVPSHCELMKPASQKLEQLLKTLSIKQPVIPVINNVDVELYESPEAIRDGLVRQLYNPVRWVEIINKFDAMGINTIIECGPGKVLTGLIKRITPEIGLAQSADLNSLQILINNSQAE